MSTVIPTVFYRDPMEAMRWLERAFGLETALVVTDASGAIGHAEMTWRGKGIGIGAEFVSSALLGPARLLSPLSLDGAGSQFIRLEVESDIDGHCSRARAAGARITQDPADQFYGARTYRALDPEGHVWNFQQAVTVSPEVQERGRGLSLRTTLDEKEAAR